MSDEENLKENIKEITYFLKRYELEISDFYIVEFALKHQLDVMMNSLMDYNNAKGD